MTYSEVPQGNQDGHLADTEGVKALSSKADNLRQFAEQIKGWQYSDDPIQLLIWAETNMRLTT